MKRQGWPPSDQGASGGWAGPLCTPTPPRAEGSARPLPGPADSTLRPQAQRRTRTGLASRPLGGPDGALRAPSANLFGTPWCLGAQAPRRPPTASRGSRLTAGPVRGRRSGRRLCRQKPEPSLVSDSAQNPLGGRARGLHSSCSQGTGTDPGPDARQSRWEGGAGREPTAPCADPRSGSGPRPPTGPSPRSSPRRLPSPFLSGPYIRTAWSEHRLGPAPPAATTRADGSRPPSVRRGRSGWSACRSGWSACRSRWSACRSRRPDPARAQPPSPPPGPRPPPPLHPRGDHVSSLSRRPGKPLSPF